MHALPAFDPELPLPSAELLKRYERPGPRYTSYPAAPQFTPAFTAADVRAYAARSNARPGPRPLSLYLHVPFCFSPCFYCGCTRLITRDTAKEVRYVERLLHEAALVAPLFDRQRKVVQLHGSASIESVSVCRTSTPRCSVRSTASRAPSRRSISSMPVATVAFARSTSISSTVCRARVRLASAGRCAW